ncbi:MAG TPA: hypothetical protein PKI08_11290, partial [Aquaticitalea sp.]|nr:hypothetical protein [Aquaticitalea sp.]
MFLKYCRLSFFIALLISAPIFAQDADIDSDKQREQYEKKMKAQLDKEINDFITTLDADDFQKEIIKQKMHSYYEKRKSIYMDTSIKPFERDEQLSILPE